MGRKPREWSEADLYHVTARGVGRLLIFEDNKDRCHLLSLATKFSRRYQVAFIAWCLMGNHIHLLLKCDLPKLSDFMRDLQGSYARYFNARHGHVGHLFQSRFDSKPVNTEGQLLVTVRYIHRNPVSIESYSTYREYAWSSYQDYVQNIDRYDLGLQTGMVVNMLGGLGKFKVFHESFDDGGGEPALPVVTRTSISDDTDAARIVRYELGISNLKTISGYGREIRDKYLIDLLVFGLSVRQVERLTGIGRSIVNRIRIRYVC